MWHRVESLCNTEKDYTYFMPAVKSTEPIMEYDIQGRDSRSVVPTDSLKLDRIE